MKTPFLFCAAWRLVAAVVLGALPAVAQDVKSRPVGFLVQTIPAGQTRSFSVPFDAEPSSLGSTVGKLTAVGTNYLECASATWTPGAFSTAAAPYFVRITSGVQAGRIFQALTSTANTATRIYVSDDGLGLSTLGIEAGDAGAAFEIIPGDTLATFFGTTAPGDSLVVQGASEPIGADLVLVWGGAAWLSFYYNTAWGRWARDLDTIGSPTRNNFVLRPDRGMMLTRRGSTPLEIAVVGRVLGTPQRAFHSRTANTLTFLATMQTSDITLGALALQNSNRSLAWRGSADAADADTLLVWSGATWFSFYYNSTAGQWRRVNDPVNRDSFVIRAGTPVFIQRRISGTSTEDKTVQFPTPGS